MLVAVEGIDGSGKATLTRLLAQRWQEASGHPARTVSFPRYGESVLAAAAEGLLASPDLLGRCGPRGTALVFAAERASARQLLESLPGELVVVDRYVASNAAYQSARASSWFESVAVSDWIFDLEFTQLGLPRPDLTVLIDVPVEESSSRLESRAVSTTLGDRPPSDAFEQDKGLLARAAQSYLRCASSDEFGPWLVLDGRQRPEVLADLAFKEISALGASQDTALR